MLKNLQKTIAAIAPLDRSAEPQIKAHLDDLTKPLGSLGRLEALALWMCLVQKTLRPEPDPARIYTVAGDHGVAAAGVSPYPQEVTRQMVLNFLAGGAGVNVLAETAGVDLKVVDAGCLGPDFPADPKLCGRKIAPGTANLAEGPAMSLENCLAALELGIELAEEAHQDKIRCLGGGDMGIGNTTPSTALFCAYLGLAPDKLAGPGAGLDSKGVKNKIKILETALEVNAKAVQSGDALAVLAALGGYEIACLAGMYLGGAARGMLLVVDGYISTAAFLAASRLAPAISGYAVFSHASAEPGHAAALAAFEAKPLLCLDMRLGEGTGAALAMFLLRAAANMSNKMATFSSAGVSGKA